MMSNKKKILIIGGSGALGSRWIDLNTFEYEIHALVHKSEILNKNINAISLDIFDLENFKTYLIKLKPDIIINTAAETDVDFCERDFKNALKINSSLTYIISILSNELKIKLIHISTDHLFDDSKEIYNEQDLPNPINNYGLTKYISEEACLLNNNALVLRTNFFGRGTKKKKSFTDFIDNNLLNGKEVSLFTDVLFNPVFIDILCKIISLIINEHPSLSGILSIGSITGISKYDFGIKYAKSMKYDLKLIKKGKIANNYELTKRPKNMILCVDKFNKTIKNFQIPDIDYQIEMMCLEHD